PTDAYRYVEFQSYYQTVKNNFERIVSGSAMPTYPEPVEHCNICRWWQVCDKKRHADDYLSLVAGIRSLQIAELQKQKLNTLEAFAKANGIEKPKRGNYDTFIRKQSQAKVQLN